MRYPMILAAAMVAGCPLASENARVILENSSAVAYGVSDATEAPAGAGHRYRITPMRDRDWLPIASKEGGTFGILRPKGHVSIAVKWRGPARRVVLALAPQGPQAAGFERLSLVLDPSDPKGLSSSGVFCVSAQGRLHVLNRAPMRPTEWAPPAPLSTATLKVHNISGKPWTIRTSGMHSPCILVFGRGDNLGSAYLPRGSIKTIEIPPSHYMHFTPMAPGGSAEFELLDHNGLRRFDTVLRAGVSQTIVNTGLILLPADQTAFDQILQVSNDTVFIKADHFHASVPGPAGASR